MPNRRTSKNISHRAKRKRARLIQRTENRMMFPLVRWGYISFEEFKYWSEQLASAMRIPAELLGLTGSNHGQDTKDST